MYILSGSSRQHNVYLATAAAAAAAAVLDAHRSHPASLDSRRQLIALV